MEWDQPPPEPRDMEYYSGWEPDDDDNPFRRRQYLDRDLLPIACQAWEIDLASIETQAGLHAWPTLLGAWKVRDDFVHKGDEVDVSHAQAAVHCSQTLIEEACRAAG